MNKNIKIYEYLLFIDFDNTYFIEKKNYKTKAYKSTFKKIKQITQKKKICTIILSGNNINYIKRQIKLNEMYIPNIIVGSLGTQYKFNIQDENLLKLVQKKLSEKLNHSKITKFIKQINTKDQILYKQPLKFNTEYKKSYYCQDFNFNFKNKNLIAKAAKRNKLNIKINKCSSKSLTESRLYDVDIIHNYAGKKNTLIFLKNYFNISYSSIYVLGDSMNDYEMLAKTKNSFLVKNSSEEIIGRFKSLKQDDAYAILELIKKI